MQAAMDANVPVILQTSLLCTEAPGTAASQHSHCHTHETNNFLDKEVEGALGPASQTLLEFHNFALTPHKRHEDGVLKRLSLMWIDLGSSETPSNL